MFKVECPGCRAPYQVDERRVPPSGLKMRCPKCGTSFQVDPPLADPRGTTPNPVLNAPAGSPEAADPGRPPLPRRKPPVKGTMIGVAPPLVRPGGPPTPPQKAPAPEPDPFGSLDLPDLPIAPAAPRAHPTRPQGSPPLPRPGAPRAA